MGLAAVLPRPWAVKTREHADQIAQVLGYLPLALIHAGKAILDRLCSITDYPAYYERTWNKIRHERKQNLSQEESEELESSKSVYSSYEMIYVGLENKRDRRSKDALELLKMLSFFHRENVEYDLIRAAAMNPRREREDTQRKGEGAKDMAVHAQRRTWKAVFHDLLISVVGQFTRPSNVLPGVLRDNDETAFDEDRLRSALSLLVLLGMVTLHDENNSYWMHPLVHRWVRERPDTSTAEQAIWCQGAATALAQSIFVQPPRAYARLNEGLKRQTHLHVEQVLELQKAIREQLEANRTNIHAPWRLTWLVPRQSLQSFQAAEYAKFSLVYMHCGCYTKAETLQLQVMGYILATLGPRSKHGIDVALLLSHNYALQARNNKARELQYQALESAQAYYGQDHPTTLQVMDTLGATCLLCSRFAEAHRLHHKVIQKFSELEGFGPEHESTLTAVHNLAKVKLRDFEITEAVQLQSQAYEGLLKVLGRTHHNTLEAQDNLAGIYGFLGEEHLTKAHTMCDEVLEIRTKELGREDPFTLKSKLTLAKIKTTMDQFDEAEQIFQEGIPFAERNLGEHHLGTLTARTWHAHLYWRQGRYSEAATIWEDVIKKAHYEPSKRADGEHGDRTQAMWFLAHCYEDQGKIDEALAICKQISQLLQNFGGEGLGKQHKLWQYVEEKEQVLQSLKERRGMYEAASDKGAEPKTESSFSVPPKKVVKDLTY